ncbi:MAG TPA: hypothetical protein VH583_20560 [Vicinamibacterales bacterium]|jgi:hypothetical protein
MLWFKSWHDTRWRFLIGFVLLTCSAAGIVWAYPRVMELMPLVPSVQLSGEIGRRIRENAELARDYRGYVWSQWFRQTPVQLTTLFAVLLGSGDVLSHGSSGATLFSLSLPVTRRRLLGTRIGVGLVELAIIAIVPSFVIPLVSPAVGASYSAVSALVHGVCLFAASAVFFSLAVLLSTIFADLWRPLLVALCGALVLGTMEGLLRDPHVGLFSVMNGSTYFWTGRVPWLGLLFTSAASMAMLYGADVNFARRDF